jgi:hypothetical protein
MFQEHDLVQVVALRAKTHGPSSDYFFRPPLLGDIGAIVQIAMAGDRTDYFVECLDRHTVAIWVDQFAADELAAASPEAARKFTPSYGADAHTVARRAYEYHLRMQLIEIACAMLSGQLGIIAGARQIVRLRPNITAADFDRDFLIFVGIDSETDALPAGAERQYWDPAVLLAKDLEIARADDFYRESALAGCRSLVAGLQGADDLP